LESFVSHAESEHEVVRCGKLIVESPAQEAAENFFAIVSGRVRLCAWFM
jgi:hypothetical protein